MSLLLTILARGAGQECKYSLPRLLLATSYIRMLHESHAHVCSSCIFPAGLIPAGLIPMQVLQECGAEKVPPEFLCLISFHNRAPMPAKWTNSDMTKRLSWSSMTSHRRMSPCNEGPLIFLLRILRLESMLLWTLTSRQVLDSAERYLKGKQPKHIQLRHS